MNKTTGNRTNTKHAFILENDHFPGDIIPDTKIEMWKTITLRGDCSIGGGVMGSSLDMRGGPCTLEQSIFIKEHAAFTLDTPKASSLIKGCIQAEKTFIVTSPVKDHSSRLVIEGDVYSDQVKIDHAFIYGNIFCNTAMIRDSIILGGVYATTKLEMERTVVGTFATRTAKLGDQVILLHPNAVTENRPEIENQLYFVFLNPEGTIKNGIALNKEDVIKRMDQVQQEGLQKDFIEPRFVLGLGNRLLNIEMITELFVQNAAILSEKYMKNNTLEVDEEAAKAFEQEIFNHTQTIAVEEQVLTFNLDDYTLPKNFFEVINSNNETQVELMKEGENVIEMENILGDSSNTKAAAVLEDSSQKIVEPLIVEPIDKTPPQENEASSELFD